MKTIKTIKVKLYPNKRMEQVLDNLCDYRRYCWNQCLETWNQMYDLHYLDKSYKAPNEYAVRNELVENKQDWQYQYSSRVLQQAILDVNINMDKFYIFIFVYVLESRCFFIYKFNDEVHGYQSFIRNNIDKIGNLKIVTEQFKIKNNFIDMLAYDSNDDRLAIIELKNVETNHDIIGQAIRYYDLLKRSTAYNNLPIIKDPKILLISPDFDKQLISSMSHIDKIDIALLKVNLDDNVFICEKYNPDEFTDIVGTDKIDIECKKKEIYTIDSYHIDEKQLALIKDCIRIFQSMYNQSLSIFYSRDKINMMYKKRVVCTIKVSYDWFNNTINISVPKGTVDEIDIRYNPNIKKFTINKKHIKLICSRLPNFIRSEQYGGNR